MFTVLLATAVAAAAPSPPSVHATFAVTGATTRVTAMRASALPAATVVSVRCAGAGCPLTRIVFASEGGPMDLTGLFKRARLRPHARVTVTLAPPSARPRSTEWTMRRGRSPSRD